MERLKVPIAKWNINLFFHISFKEFTPSRRFPDLFECTLIVKCGYALNVSRALAEQNQVETGLTD